MLELCKGLANTHRPMDPAACVFGGRVQTEVTVGQAGVGWGGPENVQLPSGVG